MSQTAGTFFTRPVVGRGTAIGDYDNDGDPEILVTGCGEAPVLLRNDSQTRNHWLKIQLVGTTSNVDGIGAKGRVQTSETAQFKESTCGGSYASGSERALLFGLGTQETIQAIEVTWQSGHPQRLENLSANQVVRLLEKR